MKLFTGLPDYLVSQIEYHLLTHTFDTFEDYISTTIGKRAAKQFNIISYFNKAWGIHPSKIVIPKVESGRLQSFFLFTLLFTWLSNSEDKTHPRYPELGMGAFFNSVQDLVSSDKKSILKQIIISPNYPK